MIKGPLVHSGIVGRCSLLHESLGLWIADGILHGPLDDGLRIFVVGELHMLPCAMDAGLSPNAVGELVGIEGKRLGAEENEGEIRLSLDDGPLGHRTIVIFPHDNETLPFRISHFGINPEVFHIGHQEAAVAIVPGGRINNHRPPSSVDDRLGVEVVEGRGDDKEAMVRHWGMVEGVEPELVDVLDHGPHVVGDLVADKFDIRELLLVGNTPAYGGK